MKIKSVTINNRRRQFVIQVGRQEYGFPYAKLAAGPTRTNPVTEVWIDADFGGEAFGYRLGDGTEGTVHVDHVMEYNREPGYMAELLLYKLTLEARRHLKRSGLSNREVIRRLGTSASQYYRLLEPTNYTKSMNQMLSLLQLLGCEIDVVVKDRSARHGRRVLVSV